MWYNPSISLEGCCNSTAQSVVVITSVLGSLFSEALELVPLTTLISLSNAGGSGLGEDCSVGLVGGDDLCLVEEFATSGSWEAQLSLGSHSSLGVSGLVVVVESSSATKRTY